MAFLLKLLGCRQVPGPEPRLEPGPLAPPWPFPHRVAPLSRWLHRAPAPPSAPTLKVLIASPPALGTQSRNSVCGASPLPGPLAPTRSAERPLCAARPQPSPTQTAGPSPDDLGFVNDCLDVTPKTQAITIDNLDFIKILNCCASKNIMNRVKKATP